MAIVDGRQTKDLRDIPNPSSHVLHELFNGFTSSVRDKCLHVVPCMAGKYVLFSLSDKSHPVRDMRFSSYEF